MNTRIRATLLALLLLVCALPGVLHAQWSEEDGGVLLAAGLQWFHMAPDTSNGVWVGFEMSTNPPITYVQHVDEDGIPLIADGGMTIVPDTISTHFMGMVATSDGGVVVLFRTNEIDQSQYFNIYAQCISADGERLWGETGVPVVISAEDKDRPSHPYYLICSDGSDGLWGLYTTDLAHIWVCGVNGDGTSKLDDELEITFNVGSLPQAMEVCPDSAGGVFVIWSQFGTTFYQHVFEDGTTEFELYNLCSDISSPSAGRYWMSSPDGEGGFYLTCGSALDLQHVTAEGTRPWGDQGIVIPGIGYANPSHPMVMDDGSVAYCTPQRHRRTVMFRAHENGDPYFDDTSYIMSTDSIPDDEDNAFAYDVPATIVPDGEGGMYFFFRSLWHGGGFLYGGIGIQRVQDDGTCLWGRMDQGPVVVFQPYTLIAKAALNDEDHSVIFAVLNGSTYRWLHLYKVLPDGRIAGRDTNVDEPDRSYLPNTPLIHAYPNPFNSSVRCEVSLPVSGEYSLRIYSILGQLIDNNTFFQSAGKYSFSWHPEQSLSSGIYNLILYKHSQILASDKLILVR